MGKVRTSEHGVALDERKPMTAIADPDAADKVSARHSRRGVTLLALGTVVGVLVGGTAGALWRQDDDRAVIKVRGAATIDAISPGTSTHVGDLYELRDATAKGPMTVSLPDQRITGVLTINLNSAFLRTGTGPAIAHSWGAAEAVLEGVTCVGSYGFSHYHDPREVGGSLNLRCADGSVLGGKFYLDRSEYVDVIIWRAYMRLTDGFYVPPA